MQNLKSIFFSLKHRSYNPIKYWNDRRKLKLDLDHPIPDSEKQLITKIVTNLNCNEILEIGCGKENFSYLSNYVGIDFSLIALKGQKNVGCADVCHLPFKTGCFDMTISRTVLMHISNIQEAITEITRVTRKAIVLRESHPSGKLAKHCFNHDFQQLLEGWNLQNEFPYEVFVFNDT